MVLRKALMCRNQGTHSRWSDNEMGPSDSRRGSAEKCPDGRPCQSSEPRLPLPIGFVVIKVGRDCLDFGARSLT
jgi:hypothetical protein